MSYFKNFIDNISISGRTFFLSIFRRHSNFHKKIVTEILAVYRIPISENLCSFEVNDEDVSYLEPSRKFNSFNLSSALYQGYLLYDNNHFLPAAFEVLAAWNKFALPESFITLTLISAFYLHDLQYMKMRLDSFFNKVLVGVSGESKKEMVLQFMKWFLFVYVQNEVKLQEQFSTQRFKWPVCEEFSGVPFEQLMECADYSSIAAQILARGSDDNTGEKGKTVLSNLFFKYFKNKPRFWTSLFSKCSTIAYFIKYVDREDLPKAYEKFKVYNSDKDLGENEKFLKLIKKVQVKFRKQVVSSETLFKLTTGEDSASQFEQLFHELIEKGKAEKDVDMRLIYHLTAKWMQISRDNITVPLPPRNAQLIALLTCASFAKQLLVKKNTSMGKGVIAQVGTGEGKSLIIAFMAIYCVKVLRKRVHILENNLGLLEKDFNEMAPLFKEFDIYPRGGNSNENEPELTRTTPEALKTKDCRNEFCSFGVTYCLRRNMERYYQDCIMKAAEDLEEVFPFKNTVLIVDEVDDLIVDSDPNQYSVAPDNEESEFVEAIKHLTENGGVPNENFQWDSFVWGLANTAYEISRDLREGIDYVRKDGTIYEIGAGGNLVDAYAYHLECLKPFPKLKTRYYAQSIPYMFSQYECLTGFSGSVGAEEYLWEQFKTWIFKVPPFLDTCRGVNKVPAQLMSDPSRLQSSVMYVMPTRREQLQKVVEIAARTYIKVPVLIIATTTREAYEIQELVLAYIALKHNDNEREIQPGDSPREFVQTFLQYKKDSVVPDRENWKSIVKNATDKCSDRYRITVTDPFGGRGHDFDVHDEMVESNYGLAVIVTSIPASEREWIQWKGRTARKDNSGQYAVVLSKEDETIKNSPHLLENAQHHEDIGTDRYLEKVIDRIIESRKEQENEKLKKMNEDIHIGRLLNQLCDSFYRDFPAMNERNWPNGEEQIELRNILTSDVKNHQDIIETFRKLELSAEMIISEDDDERYNGYDSDKDLEIIKAIEELQLNITEESVNSGNVFRNGSLKSVSYDYHANSADLETVVQNRVKEHILEKYKLSYTEISRFFSTDKEERQRTRRSESDDVRDFASTESAAHDEEEEDDIWDSENFLDFKEFKIDDAYPSCEERIPLKPQDTRGSLKQSSEFFFLILLRFVSYIS